MTSFLLQLWTILTTGYVQSYFIFFIFINAFWWLRVYIASRNKRYVEKFKGTCSVIVPVFREAPEIFENCLSSIKKFGKPKELIVTIDDSSHADERDIAIANTYATKVIKMPERVGKREQFYQASLALNRQVDVVLTVDSDTIWDDTTMNILKPFTNKDVGAVSGRQTIFDYKRTWIRHIAEWYESLRFRVLLPFQSYFGQVQVIPGRTLAIRAELFESVAAEIRHETFFGRRIITSDDASLTMGVLSRGYQAVYQDDSLVSTDAPDTIRAFWKQYLRWYRGSARRFFHSFGTLASLNPLVFLANIEFLFGTFIYSAIVATFAFKLKYRLYELLPITGAKVTESFNIWFILLLIAGYFVSSYIRNLPHLLRNKKDFLFLPVFAVFSFFFMPLLKICALFTFSENGWMTRRRHSVETQEKRVWLARGVAAVFGLLVLLISLPLPYGVDIRPSHVPLRAVLSYEAPEYYKAQQIAASYQNNDPSDDASLEKIDHVYEQYVRYHTYDKEKSSLTTASVCAKDKLKDVKQGDDPLAPINDCLDPTTQLAYTPKPHVAGAATEQEQQPAPTTIEVEAAEGDSIASLVGDQAAKLQADRQKEALTPDQLTFVETEYITRTHAAELIYPGQKITLDLNILNALLDEAVKP